jgi:hypothetical protein
MSLQSIEKAMSNHPYRTVILFFALLAVVILAVRRVFKDDDDNGMGRYRSVRTEWEKEKGRMD